MAVLGLTKLEAVNRILRTYQTLPVSALDTGGTSLQAQAEQVLDEVSTQYQARGLDENTQRNKSYTANGSGIVTVASNVIGVASNNYRVALRGDSVINLNTYSTNWGAGFTVILDVVEEIAFESLSPGTKEAICKEAEMQFQIRYRGSPDQHQSLALESARTDALVNKGMDMPSVIKPVPSFVPAAPRGNG